MAPDCASRSFRLVIVKHDGSIDPGQATGNSEPDHRDSIARWIRDAHPSYRPGTPDDLSTHTSPPARQPREDRESFEGSDSFPRGFDGSAHLRVRPIATRDDELRLWPYPGRGIRRGLF